MKDRDLLLAECDVLLEGYAGDDWTVGPDAARISPDPVPHPQVPAGSLQRSLTGAFMHPVVDIGPGAVMHPVIVVDIGPVTERYAQLMREFADNLCRLAERGPLGISPLAGLFDRRRWKASGRKLRNRAEWPKHPVALKGRK